MKRALESPILAATIVAVVCFLIYLRTLAPTVSFIDSGELATVACTLGIAHPTGYPLFTLIGWLFSRLPIATESIVRLNIMSAFFCAAGLWVFFLIVHRIVSESISSGKFPGKKNQVARTHIPFWSSVCAALVLGFSETYWSTATSVEVYSLHVFLIACVLHAFLRASIFATSGSETWWWIFGFVLGLSFTNHMTTILLAPGLLYMYFASYGLTSGSMKRLARLAIPFVLGLSVYIYLPIRAGESPLLNWGNPVELERLLWHLGGKQYRVWIFSSTDVAGRQLSYFVDTLAGEFGYLGLLLAVPGLFWLWMSQRRIAIMSLLLFFGCVFYSINYDIHDIDAYFLLAYMCMALWAGVGALGVLAMIPSMQVGVTVALVVGIAGIFFNNKTCNQSKNYLVEDYTHDMFESFRPNALVLSYQWDYWVSASYYFQHVKGLRPDVAVVDKELLRRSWYITQLEKMYPWLINNSRREVDAFLVELHKFEHDIPYDPSVIERRFVDMIRSFIQDNMKSRHVYVTSEIEPQFLQGFQAVPEGLAMRLEPDSLFHETISPVYKYRPLENHGRLESQIPKLYGASLVRRGAYYYNNGNRKEEALNSLRQALAFDPASNEARRAITVLEAW